MFLLGNWLNLEDHYNIVKNNIKIIIDDDTYKKINDTHNRLKQWINSGNAVYGVNTGFGELVNVYIPFDKMKKLQLNLVKSHAAGQGNFFDEEITRSIILSRLNYLIKGYSGVSTNLVKLLESFLNLNILPIIPKQGSVGASGDLVPLAHLALALTGDGFVKYKGNIVPTETALKKENITPIELSPKEGLAMINGTSAMTGAAAIAIIRAFKLLKLSIMTSSLYVQILKGSKEAFKHRGHKLKNHNGQIKVAKLIRELISGSKLTVSQQKLINQMHKKVESNQITSTDIYIQDAYSLRCIPQILGPVLDTFNFVKNNIENELNSCNDNPLLFEEPNKNFHGGNFHGQYIAMSCDQMNIAIAELGVLAERQINRLLDPHLNTDLPAFLASGTPGLNCGFEGAQYLATSIVSENFDLAAPSSIKSISSNGANQDIVSMGLISARKSLKLNENVFNILSLLTLSTFQASCFRNSNDFSSKGQTILNQLSNVIEEYKEEIYFNKYHNNLKLYIESNEFDNFINNLIRL
jgi:histidine ammonia-lyase/tyrosine ammonia-lyase